MMFNVCFVTTLLVVTEKIGTVRIILLNDKARFIPHKVDLSAISHKGMLVGAGRSK